MTLQYAIILIFIFVCFALFVLHIWFKQIFKEKSALEVPSLSEYLATETLMVTLAHPDDEIFIAGMLADAAVRHDVKVYAITASQGKGGTAFGRKDAGKTLVEQRSIELATHYAQLGIKNFVVLDFDDGNMAEQLDDLTNVLVNQIRQIKPDTVLTFDPNSGYTGHPDHVAIGKATLKAVQMVNNAISKTSGRDKVKNLVYFLVPHVAIGLFGSQRGKIVAKNQVPVQLAVKVDAALKIRGWKTHVSQSSYLWKVYRITPWLLYRYFNREYFFVMRLP